MSTLLFTIVSVPFFSDARLLEAFVFFYPRLLSSSAVFPVDLYERSGRYDDYSFKTDCSKELPYLTAILFARAFAP